MIHNDTQKKTAPLRAARGVHVESAGHRAIEVRQRHQHVAVAGPNVESIHLQAGTDREQNFLVCVHLATVLQCHSNSQAISRARFEKEAWHRIFSVHFRAQQSLRKGGEALGVHCIACSASTAVASNDGTAALHVPLGGNAVHRHIKTQRRANVPATVCSVVEEISLGSVQAVSEVELGTCLLSLANEELVQVVSVIEDKCCEESANNKYVHILCHSRPVPADGIVALVVVFAISLELHSAVLLVEDAAGNCNSKGQNLLAKSITNCIARSQSSTSDHQVDRSSQAWDLSDIVVSLED